MYEKEKEKLITELRRSGIKNSELLSVLYKLDRHLFVQGEAVKHAYENCALNIGYGQTISQPYTIAVMTEALKPESGMKVLEIGTGSGYQAAILYKLGCEVYTIERNEQLYRRTSALFDKLQMGINTFWGDGSLGLEDFSPYDRIIVTAAGPRIPNALRKQMIVSGKMIMPVGSRRIQNLELITKIDENKYVYDLIPKFVFVPLIGEDAWKNE